MDAPTVANKIANRVIDLESKLNPQVREQQSNPDPDEIFYSDDEIFQSEEEEDSGSDDESHDTEDEFDCTHLSYAELSQWKNLKKVQKKIDKLNSDCENKWSAYCKCSLTRQIGLALEDNFVLESKDDLNSSKLESLKLKMLTELEQCISKARETLQKKDICKHDVNNLNSIFKTVIAENDKNPNKTFDYVKNRQN